MSFLFYLIQENHHETLEKALKRVKFSSTTLGSALLLAVRLKRLRCTTHLLKHEISAPDKGWALWHAASNGYTKIVKQLLEYDGIASYSKKSALYIAFDNNNWRIFNLIWYSAEWSLEEKIEINQYIQTCGRIYTPCYKSFIPQEENKELKTNGHTLNKLR